MRVQYGGQIDRRTFGLGMLSVVAAATLAACGGDDSAGASGDGVPVEHAFGTTTVPKKPTKVVSVGLTEQDTLLALGLTPAAVTEWYGEQPYATWPWAQSTLGSAKPEVLKTDDGFQFEKIGTLKPDLIVGTNAGITEQDYAKLSDIAPTIAHPKDQPSYFAPWRTQTELIGKACSLEKETADLIAGVDKKFADAAAANPQFAGAKVIFLQNAVYDGNVVAYQQGLSTDFLTDLGFTIPSEIDEFVSDSEDLGQAYIPIEQLSVLNAADVLIWGTESQEDVDALMSTPGFTDLAAVQANRSIYTGGELAGAIYFTSPLSLPYVVDQLVPQLAAALPAG